MSQRWFQPFFIFLIPFHILHIHNFAKIQFEEKSSENCHSNKVIGNFISPLISLSKSEN